MGVCDGGDGKRWCGDGGGGRVVWIRKLWVMGLELAGGEIFWCCRRQISFERIRDMNGG